MNDTRTRMRFHIESERIAAHQSQSVCKSARITLDADLAGIPEAFHLTALLLAAPSGLTRRA